MLDSMHRGFTVVELVITLAVVTILLILSVVGLNGVQANARDTERESDIAAIARGLEQRYMNGNSYMTNTSVPSTGSKGSYPSSNEIRHMLGENLGSNGFVPGQIQGGYLTKVLPGTTESSFATPTNGNDDFYPSCPYGGPCTQVGNTSEIQKNYIFDNDRYLYEPISSDGSYCFESNCTGYNLYWKKESENWALKVVRSKKS